MKTWSRGVLLSRLSPSTASAGSPKLCSNKAGNFNWEIYFTLRKTEGKDLLEKWVRERCRWSVFSLAPVHCTSSFSMDGILQPHGLDSGAFDKLETIADNFSRKILPRGFLRGVGLAYRK